MNQINNLTKGKNILDDLIINPIAEESEIIKEGKEYLINELPSNRLNELDQIENKIIDEEIKIEEEQNKNLKSISPLLESLYQQKNKIMESIYNYFGITNKDNSIEIDCLKRCYELKKGKKVKSKFFKGNLLTKEKFCIKKDRLLICDGIILMEIPLAYIGETQEIKKKILISNWDPKENISSIKYKNHVKKSWTKYMVKLDKFYKVTIKDKYILIPSYDIEEFKQLLKDYI